MRPIRRTAASRALFLGLAAPRRRPRRDPPRGRRPRRRRQPAGPEGRHGSRRGEGPGGAQVRRQRPGRGPGGRGGAGGRSPLQRRHRRQHPHGRQDHPDGRRLHGRRHRGLRRRGRHRAGEEPRAGGPQGHGHAPPPHRRRRRHALRPGHGLPRLRPGLRREPGPVRAREGHPHGAAALARRRTGSASTGGRPGTSPTPSPRS